VLDLVQEYNSCSNKLDGAGVQLLSNKLQEYNSCTNKPPAQLLQQQATNKRW
jgi:hypothetical protein